MNDDSCSWSEPLLALIELLYQTNNPNEMAHEFFSRLSKIIPFDAAIFNPINWKTLELQEGACFGNISLNTLKTEYSRMISYEPLHFDLLCLTQLNASVKVPYTASSCLFSTPHPNQPTSYRHTLGVFAGCCQNPVAAIKLFRLGTAPDFSDHETKILDRLAIHVANALYLESTKSALEPIVKTGLIVLDPYDNVIFRNDFVSKILGEIPLALVLQIARNGGGWLNNGMELYRVENVPLTPNSLLTLYEKKEKTEEMTLAIGEGIFTIQGITLISIKPFKRRSAIENRLKRIGLSRREIDVTLKVMRGLSNSSIAKQMYIDETTVKDHLQRIFAKINIKTRTELISKLLGLDIELANHEIPIAPDYNVRNEKAPVSGH